MALKQILDTLGKIFTADPRYPELDSTRNLLAAYIGWKVVARTASDTALTAADSGTIFTNVGANMSITFTLPPTGELVAGVSKFKFAVIAGFQVTVSTGEGLGFGFSRDIDISGSGISSSDVGSIVDFIYIGDDIWIMAASGVWDTV